MNKKFYHYKSIWLLLLFVVYLLIGFFYAPKIINQQLSTQLAEQLDMHAEMTHVKFNPLTFNIEVVGLKITDANQQTWFDSQVTAVNFDPLNLLWGQWKFSDLNLVQPKITLLTDPAGQVLIPALPEFPDSMDDSEIIDFSIHQISVSQGRMKLQAGNIKKDFSLNISSIEISHDQFSMADEDTRFDITITTENDESMALKGRYNHFQQTFNSDIQLIDWQATTFNQVLPDELAVINQAGSIQARGNIDWILSKKPLINFNSIEIKGLQGHLQNDITINQLQANILEVLVDTEAQTIQIGSIVSNHAKWQINWPFKTRIQTTVDQDESAIETNTTNRAWQVLIEQINITKWPVQLVDNHINASFDLTVESLELLKVNNLNQAISVYSQLETSENGSLGINGDVIVSPLNINASVNLTDIPLLQISPWITNRSDLVFTQGKLNTTQRITYQGGEFNLTGRSSINDALIQNQNAQVIAEWGELMIGASSISSQDKTVVFDQITLDQANGLTIFNNQDFNIEDLKVSKAKYADDNNDLNENVTTKWTIKIGNITNSQDTVTQ